MMFFHADRQDLRGNRGAVPASGAASGISLAALSDGGLARRFHAWLGRSGRRYVCSVFDVRDESAMEALRYYGEAVVLAVRRDERGEKSLAAVGETGSFPELFWRGRAMAQLMSEGIVEFHVHLMAETAAVRLAIIEDMSVFTN